MAFTQARRQDGKEIGFKIVSDMVGWLLLSSPPKLLYICEHMALWSCLSATMVRYPHQWPSTEACKFTKNNFSILFPQSDGHLTNAVLV